MSFQYTLANLLASVDDGIAVLFLDDSGEVVDLACADRSPYEMKIVGAYVGIYLRQLGEILDRARLGLPSTLYIEQRHWHCHACALADGYYLVLVHGAAGLVSSARRALDRARAEIVREIFS